MSKSITELKKDALDLFHTGLEAVKPDVAVHRMCRTCNDQLIIASTGIPLAEIDHVYVVGAGKGTAPMAAAMEDVLKDRIHDGLIVVKYDHSESLSKIRTIEAGHPVPDENGMIGAEAVMELANTAGENDLVICLLSGGGSALLPLPEDGITLSDKQKTTSVLLGCGATIHEINAIRKHLSKIKGGWLAEAVYPAKLVTLIISDVIGDDLDVIASGPTVPDSSTFEDCMQIIEKYGIADQLPDSIMLYLNAGLIGEQQETPKEYAACFERSEEMIIAGNIDAVNCIKNEASCKGYTPVVMGTMLEGESRDVAGQIIEFAKQQTVDGPLCVIAAGETTVTIKGDGKGGRNQEMVLSAAIEMADGREMLFLSCGTDGTDGPTDATGAIADHTTIQAAIDKGVDVADYLNNNDAYHFFETVGGSVKTGPTKTNVMDMQILLMP